MVLAITTVPDPILRKKGLVIDPADLSDAQMKKLIEDMRDTMYASDGVGIAAPQVGQSLQICVIAKDFTDNKANDLVLINPLWQKKTTKKVWGEEGCLSVPNVFGKVQRYNEINVKALDPEGNPIDFNAKGFFARIIQHEIDHLNGMLFIDKAKAIRQPDHQIL